jgi:type II secretory pathway component PulF
MSLLERLIISVLLLIAAGLCRWLTLTLYHAGQHSSAMTYRHAILRALGYFGAWLVVVGGIFQVLGGWWALHQLHPLTVVVPWLCFSMIIIPPLFNLWNAAGWLWNLPQLLRRRNERETRDLSGTPIPSSFLTKWNTPWSRSFVMTFIVAIAAVSLAAFQGGTYDSGLSAENQLALSFLVGCQIVITMGFFLRTAIYTLWYESLSVAELDRIHLESALWWLTISLWLLACVPLGWVGLMPVVLFGFAAWMTRGVQRTTREVIFTNTLASALHGRHELGYELQRQSWGIGMRIRDRVHRLAYELEMGAPLPDAVCHSRLFPATSQMELCTAADAGQLQAGMDEIVKYERDRFRRYGEEVQHSSSLLYFLVMLMCLFNVLSFIHYYIVPKFKKIFADFETEFPPFTKQYFRVIDGPEHLGAAQGFILLVALPVATYFVFRSLTEQRGWQRPIEWFGVRWGNRGRTPDLLRALRWVIIGNRPLDVALDAMHAIRLPFGVRSRLEQTASRVRNGGDPWQSLGDTRWLTQPEVELLQHAQMVGNLPWVLGRLSDSLEATAAHRRRWWFQVTKILATLLFGILVGLAAVALLMPHFQTMIYQLAA